MHNQVCLYTSKILACACLLFTLGASAKDPIKVNPVVPYANARVGNKHVRTDCDWNKQIVDYLVEYSKGRVEVTNDDLTQIPGKAVSLAITNVHTAGGPFSGPKWGTIKVTLLHGGRIITLFSVEARSDTGGFTLTGCGALKRVAKALGARTARRIETWPVIDKTETKGN